MTGKETIFFAFLAILTIALSSVVSLPPLALAQSSAALLDPLSIPKWENQLTGPPPVYQPTVITDNGKIVRYDYTVTMSSFQEQILPPSMNLMTTVWGYGGVVQDAVTGASLGYVETSPGPTFEVVRGIPAKVKWVNNITAPFLFPVDPSLHWANPNKYGMVVSSAPTFPPGIIQVQAPATVVPHLHGGETQSYYDGTPDEWFTAEGQHGSDYTTYQKTDANAAIYYYNNVQQPTTLWYHDHALGVTRLTVYSGLTGFYLIRENGSDDKVAPLLPSGNYEMPIVLQDRSFRSDGSLYYPTIGNDPAQHPYWVQTELGNTVMVNGKVWPNMNVDQGQYRFRIVDASNSRIYILSLQNEETNQTVPFVQIGSDGGYLKNAAPITSLTISPGERADILIDFSRFSQGTTILLKNTALLDSNSEGTEARTIGQVLRFTITEKNGFTPKNLPTILNPTLDGPTFPNLPEPTKTRLLTLNEVMGSNGMTQSLLNGQLYSSVLSETPTIGSTEEWSLIDLTGTQHSIHVHLVQFQLVSRQNFDETKYNADWLNLQREHLGNQSATPPWPANYIPKELPIEPYLIGAPTSPTPNEIGWKDTVLVDTNQVVTFRIRFASQDGTPFPFDASQGPGYVWHCHLLEHEDNEMMRPYKLLSEDSGASNILIPAILILIVVIILAFVGIFLYTRKRKMTKKSGRYENRESLGGNQVVRHRAILRRFNINFVVKAGLTIVIISWLIYTAYWTYKFAAYTPNIKYNTDIYSSLSLIFLTVGAGARTAAGVFGLTVMAFVWRGKWTLTTRRLLITSILLEAFYLISYIPTAGVGPHIADPVLNVEATIPSLVEAIAVPVPLFMLASKLTKGEKFYGDAIKWSCIAGAAYLFVFWVRFNVQWFATFIQTPNYNPFDDIGLPGHGVLYVLNYPLNMFEFLLTLVGFMILCFFALWALLPAIRKPGTKPSLRRIGLILLFLSAYVITIAGLFGMYGHVGGHSIWSEFFAIHNVDRWLVSLPLLAIPLILYKEKGEKNQ